EEFAPPLPAGRPGHRQRCGFGHTFSLLRDRLHARVEPPADHCRSRATTEAEAVAVIPNRLVPAPAVVQPRAAALIHGAPRDPESCSARDPARLISAVAPIASAARSTDAERAPAAPHDPEPGSARDRVRRAGRAPRDAAVPASTRQ